VVDAEGDADGVGGSDEADADREPGREVGCGAAVEPPPDVGEDATVDEPGSREHQEGGGEAVCDEEREGRCDTRPGRPRRVDRYAGGEGCHSHSDCDDEEADSDDEQAPGRPEPSVRGENPLVEPTVHGCRSVAGPINVPGGLTT